MLRPPPPSPADVSPDPRERVWRVAGLGAIVALVLIVTTLGLYRIAQAPNDVPPIAQLGRDARDVYGPAFATGNGSSGASRLLRHHEAGAHTLKLAWLALNGQIDARGLALLALGLHVAALGALFLFLRPYVRLPWIALLAGGVVVLHSVPGLANAVFSGDAAGTAGLLVLSLLHLRGMSDRGPRTVRWWLGLAAGGANIAAATPGLASAAALVVWLGISFFRDRVTGRRYLPSLIANGLLLGVALALLAVRLPASSESSAGLASPLALWAWPFAGQGWGALIVWAPAIAGIVRWLRERSAGTTTAVGVLALLALWSVTQAALLGATRSPAPALLFGFLVNAACLIALPVCDLRARQRNLFRTAIWVIFVTNAALQPTAGRASAPVASIAATNELRQVLAGAELFAAPSAPIPDATAAEIRAVAARFNTPKLLSILPASVRVPLALAPEAATNSGGAGFQAAGAPDLPARDALPALGTWHAKDGGTGTGEFTGPPLMTSFPILQLRIAGTLRPPATSLVLRTTDGTEIAPLDGVVVSLDRWKRINFSAPRGAFQIVARDTSATESLAFTAPVEVGSASRLAGKLPRFWPWTLTLGGLALAFASVAAMRAAAGSVTPASRAEPWLNWRVVPWLGVLAYAVFFSNHLDTAAGPNDSGGYLNLAKTLLEGRLTAAPRVLFADEGNDITPYLPTTFHPRPDGRMSPEYPVGLPLEIWAVGQFMPLEKAVPTLILLQLTLALVFTHRLARAMGLPESWSWLAAGIVGLSPVYLFQGLQPQSDGPALVWVTAAVGWAWSSREKPWHAVLAGLATALAVLIRPSNVLCLIPVAACLYGSWRRLAWWALAGLPFALWLMWYQHQLYGSWHTTGYGDVSSGFGLRFLPLTLRSYALWLPELFTPLVVFGLAAPFFGAIPGRVRVVLVSWCVAFGGFYAVYWCTWDNWYNMRFVLPAMPAALVLSLLVIRELVARARRRGFLATESKRTGLAVVAAALLFGWLGLRTAQRRVLYWAYTNREHSVGATWVRDNLPANAVIFAKPATNPLMYYTSHTFVRSDHPKVRNSPAWFERLAREGRPVYALTYHWEDRDLDRSRGGHGTGRPDLPGEWERVTAVWEDDMFVWRQKPMRAGGL